MPNSKDFSGVLCYKNFYETPTGDVVGGTIRKGRDNSICLAELGALGKYVGTQILEDYGDCYISNGKLHNLLEDSNE